VLDFRAVAALSPTGRVILGFLGVAGPHSGYGIKRLVDGSARFFWAVSYGQIYPELRRLREAEFVTAKDKPTGGRARVEWSITPAGSRALREWLTSDDGGTFEMRDEGMLRLFFLGGAPEEDRPAVLGRIVARHRQIAQQLERIRPFAAEAPNKYPSDVLETGIAYHEWLAERFARIAAEEEPDG
jgi:DNA-binding PadR family transcriptional regulator